MKTAKPVECNFHPSICEKICTEFIKLSTEANAIRMKIDEKTLVYNAKWKLAERKNLSERKALGLMMRISRNNRRKLVETAALVLSGKELEEEPSVNTVREQNGLKPQAGR